MSRAFSRKASIVLMAITLVVAVTGCTAIATDIKPPSLLQQVVSEPGRWQGKIVQVAGKFSGWQGKCEGMPPATRSDWTLEDGSSCIYVSGGLPPGFSPQPPGEGYGKTLVVRGVVRLDTDGRAYIADAQTEPR